jgi:hypothetical protein
MSVVRQLSVLGLMLALAGIDFAAALVAQDFADRRRGIVLLLGCALQVTLFLVYALALRLASLSIVTLGWIVLLQVALFATDLARGRLHPGAAQWTAVVVVLVAQAFLVATTTSSSTPEPPSTATTQNPPPGGTSGVSIGVSRVGAVEDPRHAHGHASTSATWRVPVDGGVSGLRLVVTDSYEIPYPAGDPDGQTSTADLSPGRSPVTR